MGELNSLTDGVRRVVIFVTLARTALSIPSCSAMKPAYYELRRRSTREVRERRKG